MSRFVLRALFVALASSSLAMAAACGGEGTSTGGTSSGVASNSSASGTGGIDTPERNVICPMVDGGPMCPDAGADADASH